MGWLIFAGWVLLGLLIVRVVWRMELCHDSAGEPPDPFDALLVTAMCIICAPLLAGLAAFTGAFYGLFRLATMPGPADRRAHRAEALADERERVLADARRLGLPLLDVDRTDVAP